MHSRRSVVVLSTSVALILTPAPGATAPAAAAAPAAEPSVAGAPVAAVAREPGAEDRATSRPVKRDPVVWPVPGRKRVAGVTVQTLDPAVVARLGGIGLGVRVSPVDTRTRARATITLDYSGFAHAYGASFADRLVVLRVPGHVRVPARNDLAAQRMTVEVTPDPKITYVLASGTGGTFSGNFGATDLAPSGTWQTGLSSGSFSYSYPIPLPASPHGRGPELSFQYSSSAVDGMTSATNAQSGWTGLGWQLNPGYIERRYKPCSEDANGPGKKSKQKDWGHLCWESPDENDGQSQTADPANSELFISLAGRSTRIVKDHLSGTWKTQEDFGWRVEFTGAHWIVTTQTGDVYRFGARRDSAWQIPYAGDDPGEPCNDRYANGGRDYPGMCTAPWRWNLDQIVDADENLTTLYWKREVGKYRWYATETCCGVPPTYTYTPIGYDRGGYLDYVEWGANTGIAASRPTSKVVFNMVSRCSSTTTRDDPLADPYPVDTGTGDLRCGGYPAFDYWDVPDDLVRCDSSRCNAASPAFFIMRRLDSVVTYSYDAVMGVWQDVHKLQLRFKYVRSPEAGGNGCCTPALWLDYIRPVGVAGSGEVRLPPVDFDAVELNGRVDWGEDFFLTKPRAILPRIATVHNGFGGRIEVTYGRTNPCPDGGTGAAGYDDWYNGVRWDSGTQDCFRVYDFWFPFGGGPEVVWGVYHKYLVTKVVERDVVGGSPPVVTAYEYEGRPAWARPINYLGTTLTVPSNDTGGTSRIETASWSEARGYETVRTVKGSGTDPAGYTVTTDTFFRGMFDDTYSDGTKKQTRITDFDGGVWDDTLPLTGRPLQTRHWDMTAYAAAAAQRAYAERGSTRHEYARVPTGDGPGVLDPARIQQVRTRSRDIRSDGSWRYTDRRIAYDGYGLPIRQNDYGEEGVATDNTCTSTTYSRSIPLWMISYPATTEERAGDSCDTGPVTGRTTLVYDGATEPSDGNVTEERRWVDPSRVAVSRTTYDGYGRVTSTTDPLGNVTTTAYEPSVGWPEFGVRTTDPAGFETTVWHSRWHGQPTKLRDPEGRTTEFDYDPLARTTAMWGPGHPRSGGTPTSRISYTATYDGGGQPTAAMKTKVEKLLTGTGAAARWQVSVTYDDGFGRVREAQTPAPGGGRIVVASVYDARGKLLANSAPVHNASAPGSGLLNAPLTAMPLWTRYQREGSERTAAAVQFSYAAETRRMGAEYRGEDVVSVNPPTGGATEYHFDAHDRVTRMVEWVYWGVSLQTRYEYDTDGNVTQIIDAKGNVRTFGYDWQGRMVSRTDPDSGTTTSAYDLAGRLMSTVDGRGQKVSYVYDSLGRKTSQWAGDPGTGTKLAEWTYDDVVKGQLSSATRFVGADAYRHEVTAYDAGNRPTATRVTVPAAEGALAGTYEFAAVYNAAGQKVESVLPAAAGLARETLTLTYTDQGRAKGLTSDFGGSSVYVKDTRYTPTGKLSRRWYGPLGQVVRTMTWDPASDRLSNVTTLAQAHTASPVKAQDDDYFYDAGNNVVRIADKTAVVDGQLGVQLECFNHDSSNRLIFAWTTTRPDCSDGWYHSPDGKGPDPYWRGFTYDEVGNLTSVDTGGHRSDYVYPAAGSPRPNAVTSIVRPDRTDTYDYDAAGRMTSRTVAGQTTSLVWNELGQLAKTTVDGRSTDYVYNTDGERLIRREPDATTLYLGDMELRAAGGTVTAKRYYTAGDGAVVAVRDSGTGTLTWLAADPQRSEQIAIDDTGGRIDRQRYLPFGGRRGGRDDITATDRGFLGKTEDGTGLVLLDARYYDPALGRFISPDPALDLRTPQWMNTYAYAGNNPVSRMDPTGLASCSNAEKNCGRAKAGLTVKQRANYQRQCWYQGKNCSKLPKAERVPPWKRKVPKARTVRDALYALADAIARTEISKAVYNTCTKTVPDVGGRCEKAAEELGKVFNRAKVDAFCQQYKALCAAAAPDYISLDLTVGRKGLFVGLSITVTRTGQVYIAVEAGAGAGVDVKGLGIGLKVGWVYGPGGRRADDSAVSGFPAGAAEALGGSLPLLNEFWGIATTQTNYAHERGAAPPGISWNRSYGFWAASFGPLWKV